MNKRGIFAARGLMLFVIVPAILMGCESVLAFERSQIVVQWTTGSEFNTAGFNLYRSETEMGTYVKITEQLIPATPDPIAGGRYDFVDKDVVAGRTYYYQLEEVEISGVTARHGPIVATAPTAFDWRIGLIVIGISLGLLLIFRRRTLLR